MVDLRIVDAPSKPTEEITGEEKLPTGGSGNYSVTLDSVADFTTNKKDLADNSSVNAKVNGVRQEIDNHIEDLINPHQVTKGQVGLGNVDNTADADKPVSNATQAAIITATQNKADKTYVDIKTHNSLVDRNSSNAHNTQSISNNNGETQQQINDYVGVNWYVKSDGYASGDRVRLLTGEIVQSTVNANTNNPNVYMMGWVKDNSASQIFDESGKTQQEVNNTLASDVANRYSKSETNSLLDQRAAKSEVMPSEQTATSFKNVYSTKLTNQWDRVRAKTPCGRAYIWKNPKYSTDTAYRFSLGINQSGWNTAEWDFIADVDNFYRMRYGYVGAIRDPSTPTEAVNMSATPQGTNGNKYFRSSDQLNATFQINFTGVGFLMNHRCDEYGGLWEISVDDVYIKTISTNISNPENAAQQSSNITKLITQSLSSGAHTATFKFIGGDPLYPATGGISRGWFKILEGTGVFPTAVVVLGSEMGMAANGTTLVSNNILEFAIGGTPTTTSYPSDWIPAHGSASGCIVVNSRKIFINNNQLDDQLSSISSEVEIKEFTMIQDYTAYNSYDTTKAYPLWRGLLITKFNQKDGLCYTHNFKTISEFISPDGYTAMGSAQRRDSSGNVLLKTFTCDNGFKLDISTAPPAAQITHYAGNLTSASWEGDRVSLAMKVESAEASGAIGRATTDGRTTVVTERPDRFCKLYFKPLGTNKVIPPNTEFSDIHYVWLSMNP